LPLSVLSVLARRNVDPWEEAAKLCRLPEPTAVCQLAMLLGTLPHDSAGPQEPTRVAIRLIALLPPSSVVPPSIRRTVANATRDQWIIILYSLGVVGIFIAMAVLES
jgi:hypothetical protein